MVYSRSDIKRRSKEASDPQNSNPKRTKVHAQRKFAQGSGMNSPIKEMSLVKEKEKVKHNSDSTEELPSNQPPTEDFLSFLCFRGTQYLTPRLQVFNEMKSSQRKSTNSSKHASTSSVTSKQKVTSSPQDRKKRLSARRAGFQKGNAVRARTASNERQAVRTKAIERQLQRKLKAAQQRVKPVRKPHPAILKRLGATRLRAGLRSGGQLPMGSDTGLNTDRKIRRGRPKVASKAGSSKSRMESESKVSDSDNDDTDDDDDEEEEDEEVESEDQDEIEEEPKKNDKKKDLPKKIPLSVRTRSASNSPAQRLKKHSLSSRPSRKTKEAATRYMEMITKDLRNPEEEYDDDDDVTNFPELPSAIKREKQEESKRAARTKKVNAVNSQNDDSKTTKSSNKKGKVAEETVPIWRRNQRMRAKKIIQRGKPVMKVKFPRGTGLDKMNQIKNTLRTRSGRGRPSKCFNTTVSDEDEANSEDEVESVKSEAEEPNLMKTRNSRTVSPETKQSTTRATRRSDQKKVSDNTTNKSRVSNSKKRKSAPESSSVSNSDVDSTANKNEISKTKTRYSEGRATTNNRKSTRVSNDQRKSFKVDHESSPNVPPPKRISLRTIKQEPPDSDMEYIDNDVLTSKDKKPRRSKRNKDSEDDFEQTKKGRYKEESDEENIFSDEDEEEPPTKVKGPSSKTSKNKPESKQNTTYKTVKQDHETVIRGRRGRPQKNVKSKEESDSDSDGGKSLRTRGSVKVSGHQESETIGRRVRRSTQNQPIRDLTDSEEETLSKRRSSNRRQKYTEESDEEEIIQAVRKSSRFSQNKVKVNADGDSDEEPTSIKTRGSTQRVHVRDVSDTESNSKNTRQSAVRKNKFKDYSESEEESVPRSTRRPAQKGNIKDSDEGEESDIGVKRDRRQTRNKSLSKYESDSDEKSSSIKTRGSFQKGKKQEEITKENAPSLRERRASTLNKSKIRHDDSNDETKDVESDEPSDSGYRRVRKSTLNRNKIVDESNSDDDLISRKTRGSLQRGKSKDDFLIKKEDSDIDDIETPNTTMDALKTSNMSSEDFTVSRRNKLKGAPQKTKKSDDDNPSDEGNEGMANDTSEIKTNKDDMNSNESQKKTSFVEKVNPKIQTDSKDMKTVKANRGKTKKGNESQKSETSNNTASSKVNNEPSNRTSSGSSNVKENKNMNEVIVKTEPTLTNDVSNRCINERVLFNDSEVCSDTPPDDSNKLSRKPKKVAQKIANMSNKTELAEEIKSKGIFDNETKSLDAYNVVEDHKNDKDTIRKINNKFTEIVKKKDQLLISQNRVAQSKAVEAPDTKYNIFGTSKTALTIDRKEKDSFPRKIQKEVDVSELDNRIISEDLVKNKIKTENPMPTGNVSSQAKSQLQKDDTRFCPTAGKTKEGIRNEKVHEKGEKKHFAKDMTMKNMAGKSGKDNFSSKVEDNSGSNSNKNVPRWEKPDEKRLFGIFSVDTGKSKRPTYKNDQFAKQNANDSPQKTSVQCLDGDKRAVDLSNIEEVRKSKIFDTKKVLSKESFKIENSRSKEIVSSKLNDTKHLIGPATKNNMLSRRRTRLSTSSSRLSSGSSDSFEKSESNEYENTDDYDDHYDDSCDIVPRKPPLRKPSLTALAQYKNKDDVVPTGTKSSDVKPPASIKRKTHGERDSCDTIGSEGSSIVDCKVVLNDISDSLGEKSYNLEKTSKSGKTFGKVIDKSSFPAKHFVRSESSPSKTDKEVSRKSHAAPNSYDFGKCEEKQDVKELATKPSIGDTWRQAFINAKIPKPGHQSPVPHVVKPFVRPKLPNQSGFSPGKCSDTSKEVNKAKVTPSLSPFKARLANQSQRSQSPDAKKHMSPVHKVNFPGYESPVKRNDDSKSDPKKPETPVKSLTQLQYEKRSSEFISSYLDSAPPVLPAFESIRAYKKEVKKEDRKEVIKTEVHENPTPPPPLTEPAARPSPEGKHLNLPLAVEHTLRKNSPITVSKKPPMKPIVSLPQERKIETPPMNKVVPPIDRVAKKLELDPSPLVPEPILSVPNSVRSEPAPQVPSGSNAVPVPPAREHRESSDFSALANKKRVNMTNEEITRWLYDSTSTSIEHTNCGFFENNQCECGYHTSQASMQNSVGVSELLPKEEKIDHGVVEPPVQFKELDKSGKYVAETISTCKVEDYKEKLLSKTSHDNKMAPPRARRASGQEHSKSSKSMTDDEMYDYGFRFDRTSNSPRDSAGSDVSSLRDDASSSSELPERKIFHQKRAGSKRLSISSPTAFSAENESSIYAFKPDPPSSANKPFRRSRGKSGEQEDGKHPPSSSIAVQVNLKKKKASGAGLECSTQTERPSLDDSEEHLFYIPLPDEQIQSGVPQGVAVKLDKEGPDQRVIMRAKLVTKPNSGTSTSTSTTSTRTLVSPERYNQAKPEQKVRPLWSGAKAPVGTVQPTLREATSCEQDTGTSSALEGNEKSLASSSQTPQATQISQPSLKNPDSPRAVRNSTKAQKQLGNEPPIVNPPPTPIEWKGTEFPPADIPPILVNAPTFYPTEKEFQEPLEYIEKLTPLAQSFGICRIVPPSSFKPECKVSDDMRFTAINQYVHKLMERWGPNVRELCAIKKYLATQSISLIQLPLIGSMEVDLPRLYQTVQQCGGLKEVIEKKRWAKVADLMKIPKSAQDRVTKLDDIYCKYLLPYDTLSHEERTKLLDEVDEDWKEREKRLAAEDESGDNASTEGSEDSRETDDGFFDCISKGKNMPLSAFFRIARNTMSTWFKDSTPTPDDVETEFWRHVSAKTCHVCVHCGSIDSSTWGCGFPTTKTSATSRHPWNLKVLTNSPGSVLRSLGQLMGVTVPTLHVGMLFSSCCWYRDPHALPWIEYLHTGASKIWYGVPDSRAGELRKAMYPLLPKHTRDRRIWLPSDTMMVPPQYLLDRGVSVCRVVQEPEQFILVFPKAFTSSISTGYVVSESVYFAQPSWLTTAEQVFKDIQDSCEPPVFSLHKLLFNIANDTRSSADILNQILPMLVSVIEKEVESRKKLAKVGLTSWERLPSKSGRRKKKEEELEDLECDVCRGIIFLSVVSNSKDEISYCIDHGIETLSKDQGLLKQCKLQFAFDEEEMEELVEKVKARIETKTQKKQKEKASSSGSKN